MIYWHKVAPGNLRLEIANGKLTACKWSFEKSGMENLGNIGNFDILYSRDLTVMKIAVIQIDEYFSGVRKKFDLPLEISGTDFSLKVLSFLKEIPYGQTVSYKQLAERLGDVTYARAVANACGKNNLNIIIPCHRVIASDGGIGGYSVEGIKKKDSQYNHNLKIKRYLIEHELRYTKSV